MTRDTRTSGTRAPRNGRRGIARADELRRQSRRGPPRGPARQRPRPAGCSRRRTVRRRRGSRRSRSSPLAWSRRIRVAMSSGGHVGDGPGDAGVRGRRLEARVDRAAEARQPSEELGALLERLALARERQRGGDPVADEDHGVAIAGVERRASSPLSMLRTPSMTPSTRSGHGDLAADVGVGRAVVRVVGDIRTSAA